MARFALRNRSARIRLLALSMGLFAVLLLSACASEPTPTPVPTPTPNPFLVPGTEAVEYYDEELGFGFSHPNDWSITNPSEIQGIVVSITSPDGFVTFDIERDLPPPQIDPMGYGSARMRFIQQQVPTLTILTEEETTLTDGTPAYQANWVSRSEDAETSGQTLVVFRGEGDDREAFMIVTSGPSALYQAWTGPLLFFLETLTIDQDRIVLPTG